MQFFTLSSLAVLLASTALAAPATSDAELRARQTYEPCSGLYSNSLCCATDVLGIADLDCATPPSVPTDADDFSSICAAIGQRARCCTIPLADLGVLCETPAGVTD
ncbi:Cerato-ulmin hydrophobin family [Xylariales sp. PMI_506]|nr:Cerato-ulmin hydrophobin family [Xylariales sp. PMI_506]